MYSKFSFFGVSSVSRWVLRGVGLCLLSGSILYGRAWAEEDWPAGEEMRGMEYMLTEGISNRYDAEFRAAAARYLPGLDYRLLKAQCYVESKLATGVVSREGAVGICQFMPKTWASLGLGGSPRVARLAIEGAAYYMAELREVWGAAPTETDRHNLALASYNAGVGNVKRAEEKVGVMSWELVRAGLHRVTGRRAEETRAYVEDVWRVYWRLRDMEREKESGRWGVQPVRYLLSEGGWSVVRLSRSFLLTMENRL